MGLSCLTNDSADIVCDASTVINLNATGCAATIIRAIPNRLLITDVVMDELRIDARNGRNDGATISELASSGLVSLVSIDDLTNGDFERLVSGASADTLDDGEAATIAYAIERSAIALIDERKASRICRERHPALLVGSTTDLLCLDCLTKNMGRDALADAVFNALTGARMRVLPQHIQWVIDLIGAERVRSCLSIPKPYRDLR
jgi:predicted nucleic acid-binding protein